MARVPYRNNEPKIGKEATTQKAARRTQSPPACRSQRRPTQAPAAESAAVTRLQWQTA